LKYIIKSNFIPENDQTHAIVNFISSLTKKSSGWNVGVTVHQIMKSNIAFCINKSILCTCC